MKMYDNNVSVAKINSLLINFKCFRDIEWTCMIIMKSITWITSTEKYSKMY